MVGPFLFFDQMGPAHLEVGSGIDVRPHPHINLATVTYLFAGAIDHRDSLGTFATIEPGAVNLMTGGHGIVHSERSPSAERAQGPELSGIQTWLALPEDDEEMDPAFEHVARADLPVIEGQRRARRGSSWAACGARPRRPRPMPARSMPTSRSIPAARADRRRRPTSARCICAIGEASLDGVPLEPQTLYVLRPGSRDDAALGAAAARVMLCGGEAFTTPRHVWWNFVSSPRERINEAKRAWKAGEFPKVPGDDKEWIPIPEVPMTVSYP